MVKIFNKKAGKDIIGFITTILLGFLELLQLV
jgi:hypothetical protein